MSSVRVQKLSQCKMMIYLFIFDLTCIAFNKASDSLYVRAMKHLACQISMLKRAIVVIIKLSHLTQMKLLLGFWKLQHYL